jgi:hypothetical protein
MNKNADNKSCKFFSILQLKNIWARIIRFSTITGSFLITGILSGFIFYSVLFVPGCFYQDHIIFDTNTIRDVQLLLSLRESKTENPIQVNGILDTETKEA